MKKTSPKPACVLTMLLCCAAGVGQGGEHQAYDFHLNAEQVVDFESLDVTFGSIALRLGKGSLVPMDTSQGVTGAVVIAPGQVKFTSDQNAEVLEDEIEHAMLRFNPADYGTILKLEGLKPHRDLDFQKKASPVLRKYFSACYRDEDKAIIPPKGSLAVVLDGRHCGKRIVMHYHGGKPLIFPSLKVLKLRRELAAFQADDKLSRDEKWRQDVQYLSKTLALRHPNLFFRISREDFQKQVDSLSKTVGTMSDFQIYIALSKILAQIGDAHTKVQQPNVPVRMYPVHLRWLKDGLFVAASAEQYKQTLAARLVRIGDSSIDAVQAAVATLIPRENESYLKHQSTSVMIIPEVLRELGLVSEQNLADFTLAGKDGKQLKVEIEPVPLMQLGKIRWVSAPDDKDPSLPISRRSRVGPPYWYEYLEDTKTVYFQYNWCAEVKDKPLGPFIDELLAFVQSHPVEKFIFDVRNNPGGSSPLIEPLISGLAKSKVNKKGRLFCIIGRKTFSSAVLNAIKLRRETAAVFVGEPTGGRPNHFGQYEVITLPHCKLRVQCSTKHFRHSDQDTPSFMPDILVESSSADYFAGKDPALETILAQKPVK